MSRLLSRRAPWLAGLLAASLLTSSAAAQEVRYGSTIQAAHRLMYDRGLDFLVQSQASVGSWENSTGITGICVMALIASGEDPNFGRYSDAVRAGLRFIVNSQQVTGFIPDGMYQHGFAMLALADCYGAVDEDLLWDGQPRRGRSLGQALELAVRCAVNSQKKNPTGAWRYNVNSRDADTSVAGAVLMGLLGARNAGVAVPDEALEKALNYFANMTSAKGTVAYSGGMSHGPSERRSAIAALVLAIGKRKDLEQFAALKQYVGSHTTSGDGAFPCYFKYYVSQALFQSDYEAWKAWTAQNTRDLIKWQKPDGSLSIPGTSASGGASYQTGMLLLSCALDFTLLPIYER